MYSEILDQFEDDACALEEYMQKKRSVCCSQTAENALEAIKTSNPRLFAEMLQSADIKKMQTEWKAYVDCCAEMMASAINNLKMQNAV